MVPTYPWRGDVLFLSPWRTWLPLDISLIRMSPGYSLNYKILVVWWIRKSFTRVHWSPISCCEAMSLCSSSFLSYPALVLGWIFLISLLLSLFLLRICGTHHRMYCIFLLHSISTSLSGPFSFCHSGLDLSRLAPIFPDCFPDCVVRSFAPTNFFRVPGTNLFAPFFFS